MSSPREGKVISSVQRSWPHGLVALAIIIGLLVLVQGSQLVDIVHSNVRSVTIGKELRSQLLSMGPIQAEVVCKQPPPSLPNRLAEITRSLRASLVADPSRGRIYLTLVGLYTVSGDCDQALTTLREAAKMAPHDFGLYLGLGDLYWAKGDVASALGAYHAGRYRRRFRRFLAIIETALSGEALQRQAVAGALEQLSAVNPDDPILLANLGEAYRVLGLENRALDTYRRFLESSVSTGTRRNDQGAWPATLKESFLEVSVIRAFHFLTFQKKRASASQALDGAWLAWIRASRRYAISLSWNVSHPAMMGQILDGPMNHITAAIFSFPQTSQDVCVNYQVYDVDYPDEIAIYVNLIPVAYAHLTPNETWSETRAIFIQKELLDKQTRNHLLFVNTHNLSVLEAEQAYLWGVRQVMVRQIATPEECVRNSQLESGRRQFADTSR